MGLSRALANGACRAVAGLVLLALAACSTTDALTPPPAALTQVGFIAPVTGKYSAMVVDGANGRVLYEVDSGMPRYPASLTKMMTLYLLFEALDQGKVTRQTQIPVSAYAASQPPTKLGFRPGETIDVDSAIRALVTKSANDVAVAVGEFLGGGDQEKFVGMMNFRASALGMRNTRFRNPSGLPDPDQKTTARDMATLGLALRKRFPSQYAYFSTQDFMFRGRLVRGHNDLLARVEGADGIKTGYIRDSGFNIVTSVNRDGRKLLVVYFGGNTARQRNDQVQMLVEQYLPLAARTGV